MYGTRRTLTPSCIRSGVNDCEFSAEVMLDGASDERRVPCHKNALDHLAGTPSQHRYVLFKERFTGGNGRLSADH